MGNMGSDYYADRTTGEIKPTKARPGLSPRERAENMLAAKAAGFIRWAEQDGTQSPAAKAGVLPRPSRTLMRNPVERRRYLAAVKGRRIRE